MNDNLNINKACRKYLLKDTDVRLNIILTLLIAIVFNFLLYKNVFVSRGDAYVLLMLYVFILGFSIIGSNSMVVNLTAKDKLNKRIEFILASGFDIKDIIRSYTKEMWVISSIPSFVLFFMTYIVYDFKIDFKLIFAVYISLTMMLYFEVLLFNIISLYQKNFKFFKNLVFFVSSLLIYLVASFSKHIIEFIDKHNLNLVYVLLGINIVLLMIFASFSIIKYKKLSNEAVIDKEGTWS
ncbi:MAG: beta-carotene 15,15'-monooxygenase [Eubacteriales bacterium]|uniref:beta-carotene 15,15'-monooxygenase n=1 Tax=Fenollaria sp. TaxID=1965292 RepID=UPI002A74D4C0|nr:beta-carotene 15,15'-monooxygenase [Fenollaria sp.]MDD7339163.1 beta-carotene 15,15'-monooxygenase [Eubacteriales bacterium]MDY3105814.1 beta-carotene 15,15'-monooxygenase [Fenollaria sp.]